jgi:3-oxoadipate enol-lactonase
VTDLHAVVEGPSDALVVVLSNSLGATLRMWEPQVPALTERFRVVRYDMRGHGGSPVPPGPYSLEELGSDVIELLDRLGVASASVCGLSLGGMVGLWLAASVPERIERLVVCCSSARLGPPEFWSTRAATVRARGTAAVAATVVGRWFTADYAERNPALVQRMRAMVAATPAEGYAACCEAIERMDLQPALPAVRASTLVIAGADDRATPPDHARRVAAGVPAARLVILDRAAHLASYERADAVTPLMLDHLTVPATLEQP